MKRLLIIILMILNSACSTPTKQVALHDFGGLTVGVRPSPQPTNKSDIDIDSPAWLATDCIHYRLLYASPTQLRCYNLDKWIAPPAELFKQRLQASGRFSQHRLMIQLLDFEQQFDTSKQTRVVLHFIAEVYSVDNNRLLATQDFHLQQAATTPDAAGAVLGFAQLTQQASDKLQQWLMTK